MPVQKVSVSEKVDGSVYFLERLLIMLKAITREQEIGEWGTGKREKGAGRGEPGI